MPIVLPDSSEFGDLIRACVAGMKRDRGGFERQLKAREARRNAIRLVIGQLGDPELEHFSTGNAEAARIAQGILHLSRMTTDFRIRFIDRVLSGIRLNLPALLKPDDEMQGDAGHDGFSPGAHKAIRSIQSRNRPARIIEDGPSGKTIIWFHKGGVVHLNLSDGPALATYWPNGKPQIEMYMMEGRLHRPSGPAVREYDGQGKVILSGHFERGLRHRDPRKGPALRYALYLRGKITGERREYYLDGRLHRRPADGPALFEIDSGGRCVKARYFLYGDEVAPPENSAPPADEGPETAAPLPCSLL